eukprot:scaffold57831_cov72-Phaeocystis_antarctica.AAC.4
MTRIQGASSRHLRPCAPATGGCRNLRGPCLRIATSARAAARAGRGRLTAAAPPLGAVKIITCSAGASERPATGSGRDSWPLYTRGMSREQSTWARQCSSTASAWGVVDNLTSAPDQRTSKTDSAAATTERALYIITADSYANRTWVH